MHTSTIDAIYYPTDLCRCCKDWWKFDFMHCYQLPLQHSSRRQTPPRENVWHNVCSPAHSPSFNAAILLYTLCWFPMHLQDGDGGCLCLGLLRLFRWTYITTVRLSWALFSGSPPLILCIIITRLLYFATVSICCGLYIVFQFAMTIRNSFHAIGYLMASGIVGGVSLWLVKEEFCWLCLTLGAWSVEVFLRSESRSIRKSF